MRLLGRSAERTLRTWRVDLMHLAGIGLALLVLAKPAHASIPSAARNEKTRPAWDAFALSQVRLHDGPCQIAQEANRRYLHALDSDRLLSNFRKNAGLPAPGKPLGGWEAPTCELRGHFVGHYLSACALMVASTGDQALKAKADALVAELAKCQKALGGEYLSAFPERFWDRLESLQHAPWAPYYTIHKIMAGLLDMHLLCANPQALDVLKGMAAYFERRTAKLSTWEMDRILGVEFGGMSEVLYNLYAVTHDPRHLALAQRFDQAAFLGPLALEHDNLSHIHANTHIPKILGAARRWELTADERYRIAVRYFWDRIVTTRSYATGGSNEGEHWSEPNRLAHTLAPTNQECCTTYNMLKLTRSLFRWTGEPRYADYYERAFFNGILGTQDPETGMLMYYVPLATGHAKPFGTPNDSFWCCYGTGVESFAKLGDSIYFHNDSGIFVNLFIASEVNWANQGVRLEQATRFPAEQGTTLIVHAARPTSFSIHVRIPSWADRGVSVKVNGKPERVSAKPGAYLELRREWRAGDRIELGMPMSLHAQPMPDDPEIAAVMYGPLVLAGLTKGKQAAQPSWNNSVPFLPAGPPLQDWYFLGDSNDLASWIKPVSGEPLRFRTAGQPKDIDFIPFSEVIHQPYGVYWLIAKAGSPRVRAIRIRQETRRRQDARTVDRVLPGDKRSETKHGLKGSGTDSGAFAGQLWRHAAPNGWWSWDLQVRPDVPMALVCTYWGDDAPPRTFDILVNERVIGTQALDHNRPGAFFEVEYPIPRELTRNQERIRVEFRPKGQSMAGGVFSCASLTREVKSGAP